jgi:hypothetical protein
MFLIGYAAAGQPKDHGIGVRMKLHVKCKADASIAPIEEGMIRTANLIQDVDFRHDDSVSLCYFDITVRKFLPTHPHRQYVLP